MVKPYTAKDSLKTDLLACLLLLCFFKINVWTMTVSKTYFVGDVICSFNKTKKLKRFSISVNFHIISEKGANELNWKLCFKVSCFQHHKTNRIQKLEKIFVNGLEKKQWACHVPFLTLSMLGKTFSRQYFEIFFLLFPGNTFVGFDSSCKVSPKECQSLFSWEQNIIHLSSAEFAQRLNTVLYHILVQMTWNVLHIHTALDRIYPVHLQTIGIPVCQSV